MNNISNIHKSFSFTIIVIISTFVGIIMSMHYSNSKHNYLFTDSFENAYDTTKKICSKLGHDYSSIGINIGNYENKSYPEFSVPVQLILGKIKKVNNPYLPELELAFLENDNKYFISILYYYRKFTFSCYCLYIIIFNSMNYVI